MSARRRSPPPPSPKQSYRLAHLKAMIRDRVPRDEIARRFGISMSTLCNFAGRFGLTLPYVTRKKRSDYGLTKPHGRIAQEAAE